MQAIIFSLIIVRAAQGRKYPRVQTSILGTLHFVRRSQVTTVRQHDSAATHEEPGFVVDLESGNLPCAVGGSASDIAEKKEADHLEVERVFSD